MRKNAKWMMLFTCLFVLVLVLAGNVSAVDRKWDNGGAADHNWSKAENWSGDTVPTIDNPAYIDTLNADALIKATVDACCMGLDVGLDETTPCYLRMTGGTLTMKKNYNLAVGGYYSGYPGAGDGTFELSGGEVNIPGTGRMWIGQGANFAGTPPETWVPTYGTFIMTGGDVNVGHKLELGKNQACVGYMRMDGGTIVIGFAAINEDFEVGKYGTGTFIMNGGDVNVDDLFILWGSGLLSGTTSTGTAFAGLYGGTFECDEIRMGDSNASMDINECIIRIEADDTLDIIQQYIGDGRIIGYQGDGTVTAELTGGAVWVKAQPPDPNLAQHPTPLKFATVAWTPAGPTLTWTAATASSPKHDVYFGTDFDDVNDANRANPLGVLLSQNQDPCSFAFPVPPPVLSQTYYWRVDENDEPNLKIWKGLVWRFTMADNEEVEGFDEYANSAALQAVWTLSGSTIGIDNIIAHDGDGNSMKYHYTKTSPTEAYASTTGANKLPVDINDWTKVDIKALTLYFYGDPCGTAQKMYVALQSTDSCMAVVYYNGDVNDVNDPEWHEWGIKLTDFSDINDVDLTSIDKLYIGFGDRGVAPANDGNVYFDDIRLYPRRCRVSLTAPGDIDKDCDIDFVDVNIMAGDWLEGDSIRKGSDGNLMGGASWVWNAGQVAGPTWSYKDPNQCVQLDGVDGWIDLDDSDFSNFHNKTIALWAKVRAYPVVNSYLFYFSDANDPFPYRIYFLTHGSPYVRSRFLNDYLADVVAAQMWHHWVFVLEDVAGGKCNGRFYRDGIKQLPWLGKRRHSGGADSVNIGSAVAGASGFANAIFDDFRVYDYALSEAEVKTLFYATEGGAPGIGKTPPDANMILRYKFDEVAGTTAHNSSTYVFYHPLLSPAELYNSEAQGSRRVNFRDFAVLANDWLEDKLWPW